MKKTLLIFISLVLFLGMFCACDSEDSSADTETTAAPAVTSYTAEGAVQIYLDSAALWEASSDKAPYGYLFLDLDFDGTLELVQSTTKDNKSTNRFFRIDKDSNLVAEITNCDDDAVSLWDFTGGDYPQLYKENSTGAFKYMIYHNERAEGLAGGMRIGEMTCADDQIKTASMWGFSYASTDGSYDGEFVFTYTYFDENNNPREISSEEYNSILETYEQNNTNLGLMFKYIDGTNSDYVYSELSADEKYDLLLEAYKSFSYSK